MGNEEHKEARSILEFLWMYDGKDNNSTSFKESVSEHYPGRNTGKKKSNIKYPEKTNPIWRTKEGEKIPVSDMTESHISATLRVFGKYGMENQESVREWMKVFNNELKRRKRENEQ